MTSHDPDLSHNHGHGSLGFFDWVTMVVAAIALALLIHHHVSNQHSEPAHAPVAHHGDAHAHDAGHDHDTHAPIDAEHKHDHKEHGEYADNAHEDTSIPDEMHTEQHTAEAGHHGPPDGYKMPPIWACAPFVALLLCIAILPLVPATEHWWESNRHRLYVAAGLGIITLLYYWFVQPITYNHATMHTYSGFGSVVHILEHAVLIEYIPFIILLFSLYVISGGISLKGDLAAHPLTNTAFIAVGGALASFIGTTGASMLLIRPLLQTNAQRKHKRHSVIFFIFVVSNCGGLLLPIGDPPLFLGYLKGVPFLWTLCLIPEWLLVVGALLAIYFVWDSIAYKKELPEDVARDETQKTKLQLSGKINFIYLLGIVLCVGTVDSSKEFFGTGFTPFPFMRELIMLALVGLSLKSTPKRIYEDNEFNYHAIIEVAALFIGIFVCMQVPIEILNQRGAELGLSKPWHFFWTTGGLSAFLDNAPTYVVFFETAKVLPAGTDALTFTGGAINEHLLVAISLGAVFMGSLSYIGNGPNFMVKSIAEQSGVKMPSFFGYMAYSFSILIPLFVAVMFIFLW